MAGFIGVSLAVPVLGNARTVGKYLEEPVASHNPATPTGREVLDRSAESPLIR